MVTNSGTHVDLTRGAPSLPDIAVHLGRVCRFAGACREFYSVLTHSLNVGDLAKTPRLQLLGYLHDASEAVIGDITRPFKTDSMKEVEAAVWERIAESLWLPHFSNQDWADTKVNDLRALRAEAVLVGPLGLANRLDAPDKEALDLLRSYRANYNQVSEAVVSDGALVRLFVKKVRELLVQEECEFDDRVKGSIPKIQGGRECVPK